MANLDLIIFLVNNKVSDLRELEMEQYGTLKISIRVPINAVPQVPTIKLFFLGRNEICSVLTGDQTKGNYWDLKRSNRNNRFYFNDRSY